VRAAGKIRPLLRRVSASVRHGVGRSPRPTAFRPTPPRVSLSIRKLGLSVTPADATLHG